MTLIIEIVLHVATHVPSLYCAIAGYARYDLNTAGLLLAGMSGCRMFLDTSAAKVAS
jgi:hypothetical protein